MEDEKRRINEYKCITMDGPLLGWRGEQYVGDIWGAREREKEKESVL